MTPGVSAPSHEPAAGKRADPRRESTALFKGFSASSAETGLLEIGEIADINGSPDIVRPQQAGAAPPALPSVLSPAQSSDIDLTQNADHRLCTSLADDNNSSTPSDAHVPFPFTPSVSKADLRSQQPHELSDTGTGAEPPQQLRQQQQQHQQQLQQQQQPLQHPAQQPLATASQQAACSSGNASPNADAVPALDMEQSSPRLRSLAAANRTTGEAAHAGVAVVADGKEEAAWQGAVGESAESSTASLRLPLQVCCGLDTHYD